MKITTRQVLQFFLQKLSAEMKENKQKDTDPYFQNFFIKEEVIDILKWVHGDSYRQFLPEDQLNANELLHFLTDQEILSYFYHKWENEIAHNMTITVEQVIDTLNQLGHHTHYLRSKEIEQWDEYDYINYRVLAGKAGKVYTVYGIYDVMVSPDDAEKVTSPPKRFFETYDKASQALHENNFDPVDEHILSVLVGDA